MFWKDRIGKEKSDAPYYEKSRVLRRNMKNKGSPTSGIIDWADRIIRQIKTKEKVSNGTLANIPVHFAKCCYPVPGDEIVGIIHTGKGITIHKMTCKILEKYKNVFFNRKFI